MSLFHKVFQNHFKHVFFRLSWLLQLLDFGQFDLIFALISTIFIILFEYLYSKMCSSGEEPFWNELHLNAI